MIQMSDRIESEIRLKFGENSNSVKRGSGRMKKLKSSSSVGTHLTMAVLQNRLYQCEYQQRVLVEMRNQQLNKARTVAEEASRLKSDFLSSTSHELRTPLAATLNYLKLLKEGFYDNEEELKEYISVAYNSAENLVAIINDVLDIAKIEAGRMTLNPSGLICLLFWQNSKTYSDSKVVKRG
jgi:signal transduction histidine kinase